MGGSPHRSGLIDAFAPVAFEERFVVSSVAFPGREGFRGFGRRAVSTFEYGGR
jgi:hypothetical protein